MIRTTTALLLALCLVGAGTRAQSIDTGEFTLKNGLKVVTVEDRTVPNVCFSIAFHVGSRNERPGITGISHLFEHMMFNGSKKYKPTEFDRILETGGGYSNAYTSNDITFYYEEFHPSLIDQVLDLEADRMRSLKIDADNLEQERGIVKEERRVSTDNNVRSKMIEDLYAGAFVAHPYHNPVVGWMKDLDNITVEDAREYFRLYYAPNNATVFVVGNFDAKALKPKMEKLFGSIPRQPAPRRVIDAEPEQQGERRLMLHRPAELPSVAIGYRAAAAETADFAPLSLLATILSRGQSSRLYRSLVYENQIATEAGAGVDENIDAGLFTIFVQLQPGKTVADAEEEVQDVIEDIVRNGVTAEELQKAKNITQVDYVNEFKTHTGIANRLGYYEVIHGDYRKSFTAMDHYTSVTADDVRRVAGRYLRDRAKTVVVLVPEETADNASTD